MQVEEHEEEEEEVEEEPGSVGSDAVRSHGDT